MSRDMPSSSVTESSAAPRKALSLTGLSRTPALVASWNIEPMKRCCRSMRPMSAVGSM